MRAIAVLASLLLAIAAAGCGGGSDEAAPPKPPPPPPATSAGQAPDIEGVTLDGEHVSLADYRGRPVFVNVWAAW